MINFLLLKDIYIFHNFTRAFLHFFKKGTQLYFEIVLNVCLTSPPINAYYQDLAKYGVKMKWNYVTYPEARYSANATTVTLEDLQAEGVFNDQLVADCRNAGIGCEKSSIDSKGIFILFIFQIYLISNSRN